MQRHTVELFRLFVTFFKISIFTIGGGYTVIPLIKKGMVDKKEWLSHEEMVEILTIVQSIPGVFFINYLMFVGYKFKKIKGAFIAVLGILLPSIIIATVVFLIFSNANPNIYFQKALFGIKSGVAALVFTTVFGMIKSSIKNMFGVVIALFAFILITIFHVQAVLVISLGGVIGYLLYIQRKVKKE